MGKRKHSGNTGKGNKQKKTRSKRHSGKGSSSGSSVGAGGSGSSLAVSDSIRDANSVLYSDCQGDNLDNSVFDSGHNMDDSSVTGSQAEVATAPKVTGSSNADIIKLLENISTKITHMDIRLDSLDKLDQKVSNVENELVKL